MRVRENVYARAQIFAYEENAQAQNLRICDLPFNEIKLWGKHGKVELNWCRDGLLSGTYYCGEEKRSIHLYLPCDEVASWTEKYVGKEVEAELTVYSMHPSRLKEYCDTLQKSFTEIFINLPIGYVVHTVFKIHLHPWAEESEKHIFKNDVHIIEISSRSFSNELIYKHAPYLFE